MMMKMGWQWLNKERRRFLTIVVVAAYFYIFARFFPSVLIKSISFLFNYTMANHSSFAASAHAKHDEENVMVVVMVVLYLFLARSVKIFISKERKKLQVASTQQSIIVTMCWRCYCFSIWPKSVENFIYAKIGLSNAAAFLSFRWLIWAA